MDTTRRRLDYGIRGTEATAFNQYTTQIHELWYLGLDGISCKVHPTARVEVPDGTIGEFVTDYLVENRCQIYIIAQLSINDSVQFLGLSDQSGGSELPFIANLLYQVEDTGWGSANNSNQKCGGWFNRTNSIANVAWGASIDPCPAYLPWSPVNTCAVQRRVRDDFLCCRCQ